jgi:hypothetical protein
MPAGWLRQRRLQFTTGDIDVPTAGIDGVCLITEGFLALIRAHRVLLGVIGVFAIRDIYRTTAGHNVGRLVAV